MTSSFAAEFTVRELADVARGAARTGRPEDLKGALARHAELDARSLAKVAWGRGKTETKEGFHLLLKDAPLGICNI